MLSSRTSAVQPTEQMQPGFRIKLAFNTFQSCPTAYHSHFWSLMCLRRSLFHQNGLLFFSKSNLFCKDGDFFLYEPVYDTCASKHQVFLKLENRFCRFIIVFQRQSCFCSARILIYFTLSRSICRSKVLMYWCCFLSFFFEKKVNS